MIRWGDSPSEEAHIFVAADRVFCAFIVDGIYPQGGDSRVMGCDHIQLLLNRPHVRAGASDAEYRAAVGPLRPAIAYPNERWGYGTLNLLNAFDVMREF